MLVNLLAVNGLSLFCSKIWGWLCKNISFLGLVWKEMNVTNMLDYTCHMIGIYAFIYLFKLIYYLLYINIFKRQINLQIVKP